MHGSCDACDASHGLCARKASHEYAVYSLRDCKFLAARTMMRYMCVAGFPRNLGDDGRRSGGFSKFRCPVLRGGGGVTIMKIP